MQLAHALVEHETLDSDEVRKVIKGEKIRGITEVLEEELKAQKEQKAAEAAKASQAPSIPKP